MTMPEFPRETLKRGWPFAALGALLLLGAGWFTTRPAAQNRTASLAEERPVQVQKVALSVAEAPRLLVGTLRARVEADQAFRVSGKVAARFVQAGDRVKAGQALASLDSTDLDIQRASAEAELAAASSAQKQAVLELKRVSELRARGWSTDQALEKQRLAAEEAAGRFSRAERQVELARNAAGYAGLQAEADGTIISISAEPGQVVAAGQAVLRLARDGDREALVAIPEQDIAGLRGKTASLALWSGPKTSYPAALRELSPNADPATRTYAARFSAAGLAADAPLGGTVTLTLTPQNDAKVARVPLSALLDEGEGTVVFVIGADGVAKRRKVGIRAYGAREAVISAGLREGEQVATLGVHKLEAGKIYRALMTKAN